MMKIQLVLTIFFAVIFPSFSADGTTRADVSRVARFETSEMVSGYKAKITFLANANCLVDQKLVIRKFEASVDMTSSETMKSESVRIVNLYVEAPADCTLDKNAAKHMYEVNADSKRITHIYITYVNPIRVLNIESIESSLNKTTSLQKYSGFIQYLGLENGDTITSIDGEEAKTLEQTIQILEKLKHKKSVDVVVRRNGLLKTMSYKN